MQAGNGLRIRSISTLHFTTAIAGSGGSEIENLIPQSLAAKGAGAGLSAGGHCRSRVHEIRLFSVENLAWSVELWGSATGIGGSAIDTLFYLGRVDFLTTDADKPTADTFYLYAARGLDLSYEDTDMTGQIHLRLVNTSVAAKTVNAAGAVVVELVMEPTQGM